MVTEGLGGQDSVLYEIKDCGVNFLNDPRKVVVILYPQLEVLRVRD